MPPIRKKLIEVSIPLEAINKASAREKSIRQGHPSTLHLWWARRPLAACRAVLFSQLVDDPSAWPERFPTEEAQDRERKRLHRIIEDMVPWEASNNETILNAARWEIARSVAWALGEEPPPRGDAALVLSYLQTKAPPVYDPFSGGGSIPLEAQRLGLRAYGSDLNPVAVLIGKALVEIPPKFAGKPPVNPKALAEQKRGGKWNGKGAQGLAEDVRYYGQWMRDEAEKRVGHLYPKAKLADGSNATVIAWLWARTVRSPDPFAQGLMVPLVSSFMLSTKPNRKAWVEPEIDKSAPDGWRFNAKRGTLSKLQEEQINRGTKTGRGSNFSCILTGATINSDYVKSEAVAGRLGIRLMAIAVDLGRSRGFVSPIDDHETLALKAAPSWEPIGDLPDDPRNFWTVQYGLTTFASLFTKRQLLVLTTFSDLVALAREKILVDFSGDPNRDTNSSLSDLGTDSQYADAIATYLGLAVSKLSAAQSSVGVWSTSMEQAVGAFGRQAVPMTWSFPESNVFNEMAGDIKTTLNNMLRVLSTHSISSFGYISNQNATQGNYPVDGAVISTDPPYYDNIDYANLSDFFYIWLKSSISPFSPELFRRLTTPKDEELVANPVRHGGQAEAEVFFMDGMRDALTSMNERVCADVPITIYYAFKQAEIAAEGLTSAGWSSFLQAVIDSGFVVDGTWPLRTERATGLKANLNSLASSIVLVCKRRDASAETITRADFIRQLKREMPAAIDAIRKAGVGPVDMQQSVIGPGMGIFSRHARVLEDDDSAMSVKTALAIINRVWGEIENEGDAALDPETQVALAWFASYGFDAKASGDLINIANAKNIPTSALFASDVFENLSGRAGLTPRERLSPDWVPSTDKSLTIWECVQHTARTLRAEDGGDLAAARMIIQMGPKAAEARSLAYRLFQIATDKGWAAEALVYNELATEWPRIETLAETIGAAKPQPTAQAAFDLGGVS